MLSTALARLAAMFAFGLIVIVATAHAGSGQDHDHGTGARAPKVAATSPRITAGSETFDLVGVLREGRLIIQLTSKTTGAAVNDARIELAVDGDTAVAEPQPDGTYALKTPALAKPGVHEIIATITAGGISDLLVGTLGATPHDHPAAFDHDHADHHREMGGNATDRALGFVRNPLVAAGLGLALGMFGAGLTMRWHTSSSRFAKPFLGAAVVVAAALLTAGMVQAPPLGNFSQAAEGKRAGEPGGNHGHAHGEEKAEGTVDMRPEGIAAAQISVAKALPGPLVRKLTVPGVIVPDSSKLARIPAQVVGTVAEMRKGIGDQVARGEVIAVISSREVADAKSEFLAAVVNLDLQKTLFERSQALWEKRVTPEQQYLQVKATFTQAELRLDLARQKLSSLGLDAKTVAREAREDAASQGPSRLRTYEVRAPLAGRVVERKVDVGAPVGKEGDASELYSIADLTTVWVELAVPLGDLDAVKERLRVTIRHDQRVSEGGIVFVSPVVNAETRSARVVAVVDNRDLNWRPGTFISAQVASDVQEVAVRVPRTALQTIEGKQVVFVRTAEGFEKREVSIGKSDDDALEIVGGLAAGETIAVSNTFLLKADLGKAEAEHSH